MSYKRVVSCTAGKRVIIVAAIDFSLPLFDENAYQSKRWVVDVSGDGPNNWAHVFLFARDEAIAAGITINVRIDPSGWPQVPNLDLSYESCFIGGPRACMAIAEGFQTFAAAIRKKLVIEIADLALGHVDWAGSTARRLSCHARHRNPCTRSRATEGLGSIRRNRWFGLLLPLNVRIKNSLSFKELKAIECGL